MNRLLVALVCAFCAFAASAFAREALPLQEVAVVELPKEARDTLALIRKGGPFPYRKDGATFGNFEKRLPQRARGYYREYMVPTPGARDRGARRIVAGGGATGDARTSGEYYYSDDHETTDSSLSKLNRKVYCQYEYPTSNNDAGNPLDFAQANARRAS